MAKYILFKYDDERFASGDVIRNYPVKRVELTKKELCTIYNNLPSNCEGMTQCETKLHKKIKEIINEK